MDPFLLMMGSRSDFLFGRIQIRQGSLTCNECSFSDACSIESGSRIQPKISIRIQIQKTPDPDPDPSYFLTLSENNIKLVHNNRISHQNKSIER